MQLLGRMQYALFLSFIFLLYAAYYILIWLLHSGFLFPNYTLYAPRYTLILLYAVRYTLYASLHESYEIRILFCVLHYIYALYATRSTLQGVWQLPLLTDYRLF